MVVVGAWLLWNIRSMEPGTIRRVLNTGVVFYMLNMLLGAAYVLTFDDYERILSLMHLMFATFAFLCIGFATVLARNAVFAAERVEEE